MEKDWSVDETINQIKHLLLEKDAEIERLRDEIFNLKTEVHFDDQTIKSLKEINERLREALRYYAKTDYFPTSDGPWGVYSDDFGNVARAALKEDE